jgi:hypothetical protein
VRGLVIINSFSRVPQRVQLHLAPLALRLLPWGAMPLVRRFTERRLHSPHALPEDLAEFRERSKAIRREGYIRRLEILRDYEVRERLHEIQMPALFLAGARGIRAHLPDQSRSRSARVRGALVGAGRGAARLATGRG